MAVWSATEKTRFPSASTVRLSNGALIVLPAVEGSRPPADGALSESSNAERVVTGSCSVRVRLSPAVEPVVPLSTRRCMVNTPPSGTHAS